jgi:hypothetical protein
MIGSLHIAVDDVMNAHEIDGLTREISMMMYVKHNIIMTVGIYSVATGENKRKDLQSLVTRTLAAHKEIVQIHGFYYSEKENLVSVDVVPDYSVKDDSALIWNLTTELDTVLPGITVLVVVDHNYSD